MIKTLPTPLPPLSSYEFIAKMKDCLAKGQRFTPFFGSGISAQSGIMMGKEFPDYIAYTVYRVLGGSADGCVDLDIRDTYWDIRSRGWPPYPNSHEIDDAYEFIYRLYCKLEEDRCAVSVQDPNAKRKQVIAVEATKGLGTASGINTGDADLFRALVPSILRSSQFDEAESRLDAKRRHLKIKDEISDQNIPSSSRSYIDSAAIRSLSHWTRTLEFLCRVAVTPSDIPRLYLDEPDIAVIDSFNAYITRGKKPNLIHNMVARLSRSLRSQVLLTTNFDTLIEESYRAQGEPLHALAVSIRGGLPSFATVRAQDCLIKLHGDILETRADSTINDPPTDRDKDVFFQYLRGPNDPAKRQPQDFSPSHLLVLGYSGSDARCVQMIRHVLDLDPEFSVFWVCHGERDQERISKIFADYLKPRQSSEGEEHFPQFIIYQTDRSDLFLWELYQQINLSLPGGGYSVQFNHFVPPISNDDEAKNQSKAFQDQIQAYCEEIERVTKDAIAITDSPSGAARPMQACFYRLRSQWNEAAWIELEDYRNTDDLFFNILSIISQRIGQFQLEWTNFAPRYEDSGERRFKLAHMERRLELLVEKFKIDPSRWYLFLYGRNGPGGCSGWTKEPTWTDNPPYWKEEEYSQRFAKLLSWLLKHHFRIIYMPHGRDRANHGYSKIKELQRAAASLSLKNFKAEALEVPMAADLGPTKDDPPRHDLSPFPHGLNKGSTGKKFKDMLSLVLRDFFPDSTRPDERTRATRSIWLYGLTLIRQSRHPSMLVSEAVFPCPWKFQVNHVDLLLDHTQIVSTDPDKILRDNDELRFWVVFQDVEPPNKGVSSLPNFLTEVDYKGWMNTLVDHGLFLRKPGGYSWMYRDARLGLQSLFEKVPRLTFNAELFHQAKTPGEQLAVEGGFKSLRPRLHFWIGEWYLRAFYATGHYMPLVEAIYHSVQCLEHISDYQKPERQSAQKTDDENKPQKEKLQKLGFAWMALCQLRKLIRVGRKSFFFWCPGVDIVTTFFAPNFEIIIDAWKENPMMRAEGEWIGRFDRACDALKKEIEHLRDAVEAEGYAHGGRSSPMTATPISAGLHGPIDHRASQIGMPSPGWYQGIVKDMEDFLAGHDKKKSPAIELLTLNVSTMPWDFDIREQVVKHTQLRGQLLGHFLNSEANSNCNEAGLLEFAWLISELMYRVARRAKILYHCDEVNRKHEVPNHWRTVCALGHTGLSLCRNLPPEYYQADCDLRVRILTVYAVALGYLNRFSESARRFNEAHALIISGMETTNGRELARIHIRRAEMLIWRARWKMASLREMNKGPQTSLLKEKYCLVIVHIDEAWTALERGELGLGGNSHATYWWHRLIALKLSCYAALGDLHVMLKEYDLSVFFEHCLPFRRRLHLPSTLMSLGRDALIVGAGDDFRQLRIINYILSADQLIPNKRERFFGGDGPKETGQLCAKAPGCTALISDVVRVFYDDDNLESSRAVQRETNPKLPPPALKNTAGPLSATLGKYTKALWEKIPKRAQGELENQRNAM